MRTPPLVMNGVYPSDRIPFALRESVWHGTLDAQGVPTHANGRLLTLSQRQALARKLLPQQTK